MNDQLKHIKLQRKPKPGIFFELIILFVFLGYSLFYFLGRWGGLNPVLLVDKTGDAGALLSYAAAMDIPQNFTNDQILAPDKEMFSYNGFILPYIRFVKTLTGDYGLALLTLLPLGFFLHLASFYFLGKELFRKRIWAFLVAAVTAVPIVYGFWDSWGLAYDPLPRFMFQSVVAFIFLIFLKIKNSPKKWPWLMFGVSLMFFIHVISTPGIAFMLLAGFFLYLPKEWKLTKKLLFQLMNGVVFLVPFLIFVSISGTSPGFTASASSSYEEIMQYLSANFSAFLNVNKSILLYFKVLNNYSIIIPAIICAVVVYLLRTQKEYETNLLVMWLAACMVVSLLIPAAEHAVEKAVGIPPIEFDLARNLRYSIPLIEIIGISGFAAIEKYLATKISKKNLQVILTSFVYLVGALWVFFVMTKESASDRELGLDFARQEVRCLSTGKWFCPTERQLNEAEALNYIRYETPDESVFLSMPNDELANEIRGIGYRSVSYTRIDKNRIAYSYLPKARELEEISGKWSDVLNNRTEELDEWALQLSCEYGITHWLVDDDVKKLILNAELESGKIFENDSFSIIELPACQ